MVTRRWNGPRIRVSTKNKRWRRKFPPPFLPGIEPATFRSLVHSFVHYHPSRQTAYRAATKLPRPCLSLASLWMVPHLWFMLFIFSASTVLRQVVFGRLRFRFPSGVQRIAALLMELASFRSTCPIKRHRFLVMMVSISSC